MNAADPVAAIVAMLSADAGVAALAAGFVFGGELAPQATATMPRDAIVVQPSGGTPVGMGSYAEYDAQRVDVMAWSATPAGAVKLLATAALAMRRLKRSVFAGTLLHSADSAGGYTAGRDPDTQWPYAFQSFQVFHALVSVS